MDWLTLGAVIIADVLDGVADDLLVVNVGLGGDLSADHDHTSFGDGLASNLRKKEQNHAIKLLVGKQRNMDSW